MLVIGQLPRLGVCSRRPWFPNEFALLRCSRVSRGSDRYSLPALIHAAYDESCLGGLGGLADLNLNLKLPLSFFPAAPDLDLPANQVDHTIHKLYIPSAMTGPVSHQMIQVSVPCRHQPVLLKPSYPRPFMPG